MDGRGLEHNVKTNKRLVATDDLIKGALLQRRWRNLSDGINGRRAARPVREQP